MHNPCLAAVLAEVDAAGAAYELERGRNLKVRWRLNGMSGITVVSATPSGRASTAPGTCGRTACQLREASSSSCGGHPGSVAGA